MFKIDIIPKTTLDIMTYVSISGAILASYGLPFYANVLWMISNPYMTWYNHSIGQKAQTKLFAVFTVIAFYGVLNLWSK